MARPTPAKAMAIIKLGWHEYVLPVKDAAAILSSLESAEKYESKGFGDDKMHYIGGEGPRVEFTLLDESAYLQGKFAGAYSSEATGE